MGIQKLNILVSLSCLIYIHLSPCGVWGHLKGTLFAEISKIVGTSIECPVHGQSKSIRCGKAFYF